ncbi:hypothetical protein, conserved [Eimeria tenella]|uniref:SAYSvFN domain-containing protein n=1 Tax=Eimeria tenella TaxID=5802 RepID=U6KIM1_EIMTE|nr:hypothetical protein, conserved [Eimeria tenella]CDJ37789.1 hypothetical protein, conserved [Eimeria tenella]|eukprot:XP_013228627.1 hypothetical protein, conserved [Eimeria tenella]
MDDAEDLQQFLARLVTKKFWKAKLTWANAFRALLVVGVLLSLRYLGAAFASVLGIFLIFWNLGEGGGGASAYSVFNRGANYLLGDLRLQRIDQQLRNADAAVEDDGNVVAYRPPVELRSRDANKKCPCGSGRKLKKNGGGRRFLFSGSSVK